MQPPGDGLLQHSARTGPPPMENHTSDRLRMASRAVSSATEPIVIDSDDEDDTRGQLLKRGRRDGQRSGLWNALAVDNLLDHPEPTKDLSAVLVSASTLAAAPSAAFEGDAQYDRCLAVVTEIFPNISLTYVRSMWEKSRNSQTHDNRDMHITPEKFVDQVMDAGSYPKANDEAKERKRKRAMYLDSDEEEAAEFKDREGLTSAYHQAALNVLQYEFPYIPLTSIVTQLVTHGRLFKTFFVLEEAERNPAESSLSYRRLKHPRLPPKIPPRGEAVFDEAIERRDKDMVEHRGYDFDALKRELAAAKRQSKKKEDNRISKQTEDAADKNADQKQIKDGHTAECDSCMEDRPLRKMMECRQGHPICLYCLKTYGENAIGESKPQVTCATGADCQATYIRQHLVLAMGEKAVERIEFNDQQMSLANAGFKNLEECPFCDFKAIMADGKKVNKEFRCFNLDCEKVSCRLCRKVSHVPLSCEEAKQEEGLDERHEIEEAMTAAVTRICPGCKTPVIKEEGCNKMVCTVCFVTMCDNCKKRIDSHSYSHFKPSLGEPNRNPNGCPLYEDARERMRREAAMAEQAALKKMKKENPDLTEEQLAVSAKMKTGNSEIIPDGYGAFPMGVGGPIRLNVHGPHNFPPPPAFLQGMRFDNRPQRYHPFAPLPPMPQLPNGLWPGPGPAQRMGQQLDGMTQQLNADLQRFRDLRLPGEDAGPVEQQPIRAARLPPRQEKRAVNEPAQPPSRRRPRHEYGGGDQGPNVSDKYVDALDELEEQDLQWERFRRRRGMPPGWVGYYQGDGGGGGGRLGVER